MAISCIYKQIWANPFLSFFLFLWCKMIMVQICHMLSNFFVSSVGFFVVLGRKWFCQVFARIIQRKIERKDKQRLETIIKENWANSTDVFVVSLYPKQFCKLETKCISMEYIYFLAKISCWLRFMIWLSFVYHDSIDFCYIELSIWKLMVNTDNKSL
jgi:hypothetical protein